MTNNEAAIRANDIWQDKYDLRVEIGIYEGKYFEEYEIYKRNPFDEGDEVIGSGKTWVEAFEEAIKCLAPKPETFGPPCPISVYLQARRELGRKMAQAFFYAGNQTKKDTFSGLANQYNDHTK